MPDTNRHLVLLALFLSVFPAPGIAAQALVEQAPGARVTAPVRVSLNFKVPKRGTPPKTAGGATRGACVSQKQMLVPLIPPDRLGLTLQERPSFFFHAPKSPAQQADFILLTEDDSEVVYQTTLTLPQQPGIARFDLPATAPALEAGKRYHWFMTVICDPTGGPNGNPSIEGWVERVAPERTLTKALTQAKPGDRPAVYAEAGIWHETLASLADLRRRNPDNSKLANDWSLLLKSVGLNALAAEPLVECCTLANQ